MSEHWALPVYLFILGFEVSCVALSVFRRWHEDSLDREGEDHNADAATGVVRGDNDGGAGELRRRKNHESNGSETKKIRRAPSNTNVFSVFDGDLAFVTDRANKQGLAYHAGKVYSHLGN